METTRNNGERLAASLSGERFRVTYSLSGDERQAQAAAKDICFEQTVEFPEELLGPGLIRDFDRRAR